MHNFAKLRNKARAAHGTTRSAASSTQVNALLDLADTADRLLEELVVRRIAGVGASPYPGSSSVAWGLGAELRAQLDRIEHLSEVTR